tara:strand:+ start:431 stop:1303 length:873 start_codon:yes stop_codon:yes gene_type:complete
MSLAACRPGVSRLVILCLVFLLSGCSSTTFLYNRLDFIVGWYIDDYVRFNKAQQVVFDRELDQILLWHRYEELPRYGELLDEFVAALADDLTDEDLAQFYLGIEAAVVRAQDQVNGMAWSIAGELDAQQLVDFIDYLDEQQSEREVELLSRDRLAYDQDIEARLEDNLGDFLGGLTRDQRKDISAGATQLTRLDKAWLAERAHWTQILREIFVDHDADWHQQLKTALDERGGQRSLEIRQQYAHNTDIILTITREVINQRTPKQDRRLRNRLGQLREDITALSSKVSVVQ